MKNIIVLGSINMDLVVYVDHHPKIGETIVGDKLKLFPGGKGANQAIAAARTGVKTTFMGRVGDDNYGAILTKNMKKEGVESHIIKTSDVHTGTAHIMVSQATSDNTIVVLPGANHAFEKTDLDNLSIKTGDILVSQFEIPTEIISHFFKKGREIGTINLLNPAPAKEVSEALLNLVDILVVNETELAFISGYMVNADTKSSLLNAVQRIKRSGLTIIVTLGKNGALAFTDEAEISIKGIQVNACDTTGAGDCFIGVLAAMLSKDQSLKISLKTANEAASISVTRYGASSSMPWLSELSDYSQ